MIDERDFQRDPLPKVIAMLLHGYILPLYLAMLDPGITRKADNEPDRFALIGDEIRQNKKNNGSTPILVEKSEW